MRQAILQSMTILTVTAATLGSVHHATQSQERPAAAAPIITDIAPADPGRSETARLLTVNGAGFLQGIVVTVTTPSSRTLRFEGADIQSRRDTSFQVSIVLSTAGTYSFVVTAPDGKASQPFPLVVRAAPPEAPSITRVTPDTIAHDPRPQDLKVEGTRFARGMTVTIAAPDGQTMTLKGDEVMDITPTSLRVSYVLNTAGMYSLFVTDATGASSNTVTITVMAPRRSGV
jgi:hypothetical protein